ncbi:MAG: nucleoside triphosphate pyrophosphohydrolase, partial [Spirochaetia bacterium]
PDKNGKDDTSGAFDRLFSIIKTLRGPEGCPWDIKQTPHTLAPNILEEAYEFIDALSNKDTPNMREELGDIYLLVTMISYMYEQENGFTVKDVLDEISDKLVRRHPHVFGDMKKEDAGEVIELWNSIKKNVEKKEKVNSITEQVARTLPPLERAYKLQKKASEVGFDWNKSSEVKNKVVEELKELIEVIESEEPAGEREEEELGDVLFSIVNLSRFLKIDPAVALHSTNQKFVRRFQYIEEKMEMEGKELSKENFALMDRLWEEAKDKTT